MRFTLTTATRDYAETWEEFGFQAKRLIKWAVERGLVTFPLEPDRVVRSEFVESGIIKPLPRTIGERVLTPDAIDLGDKFTCEEYRTVFFNVTVGQTVRGPAKYESRIAAYVSQLHKLNGSLFTMARMPGSLVEWTCIQKP